MGGQDDAGLGIETMAVALLGNFGILGFLPLDDFTPSITVHRRLGQGLAKFKGKGTKLQCATCGI